MSDFSMSPISVLVRNERGVLARVSSLFARRGFNIISLAVGETEDPRRSRITVAISGDHATREQVVKQLERLVSVIKVDDLSESPRVERGLALIKVRTTAQSRSHILELVDIFRARVDHVDQESMVVEVTGSREKLQALIDVLRPYGILEMARTGQIVLARDRILDADIPKPEISLEDFAKVAAEESGIYNLYTKTQGDD